MASDIYQTVTDKIVAMIESGAAKYQMPWHGSDLGMPRNPLSGTKYRGINIPMLWASGFQSNMFATYKQWSAAGAQVRKGEKSTVVFFWKKFAPGEAREPDASEGGEGGEAGPTRARFMARAYNVFALEQVDNFDLAPKQVQGTLTDADRIANADAFFAKVGARVIHEGNRAFYSPQHDFIQLPPFAQFLDGARYYSTRGHETIHWTKQPHRCDRDFAKRFGDKAYAFEELVAELGAAFLCAELGIDNEPREDHAAYIASWLAALKNDKRAIFTAGSRAQAAVDYLGAIVAKATTEVAA